MAIESLQALVKASENQDICDVIIRERLRGSRRDAGGILEKMRALYAAIRRARAMTPTLRSASGMVGGDGEKMRAYVQRGKDHLRGLHRRGHCAGAGNGRKQRLHEVHRRRADRREAAAFCPRCCCRISSAGAERRGDGARDVCRGRNRSGRRGQSVHRGRGGRLSRRNRTASAMGAAALCYLGGGDAEAVCHAAAIAIKPCSGWSATRLPGLVEVALREAQRRGRRWSPCPARIWRWRTFARLCRRTR